MYSVSHPPVRLNGAGLGGSMDGSGTINPAALSAPVMPTSAPGLGPHPSPRGVKRSRSPETHDDPLTGDHGDDDDKPRKRGRPPKGKAFDSPVSTAQQPPPGPQPVQTPQLTNQALPQGSPSQSSPTKTTPTKSTVVKALPTVRDHTTDQLNDEGDEYIPRETDPDGEKKVSPSGQPLGGREYRCRTFFVPGRGDKLFMLATECARVLSYRDSYLLFNKNRSLYKIIANQAEKDDLIAQEILPYSYRSRQIAIVTAKSMFRQFGSRVVKDGRRVRDDYWEAKARKQGFTEEDAAGEKRPGAARQRESLAAEAHHAGALTALPHGQIIYSNGPSHLESLHPTLAPLPMINMSPTDDMRPRDYSGVQRPRHEMSGTPYMDRMGSSNSADLLNQAVQTADFNKVMTQQRMNRAKYLDEYWKRPHEPPAAPADLEGQGSLERESVPATSRNLQSPQISSTASVMGNPQQGMMSHAQHGSSQMATAHSYPQHGQGMVAQSPVRTMHQPLRSEQTHHRSPGMTLSGQPQATPYGYPQNQMWPPQQPQPSPLQSHAGMQQYGQQSHQQSPHPQQSPMHAPPQLHHSQSGPMHASPMGYQTMGGINAAAYPGMGRNPYQPSPSPQHFMPQSSGGQLPGMTGWSPSQHGQQGWYGS